MTTYRSLCAGSTSNLFRHEEEGGLSWFPGVARKMPPPPNAPGCLPRNLCLASSTARCDLLFVLGNFAASTYFDVSFIEARTLVRTIAELADAVRQNRRAQPPPSINPAIKTNVLVTTFPP